MATITTLTVYEGNQNGWLIQVNTNGVATDITGWTILFTVKKSINDTDANALIQETITTHIDPTNGKSFIPLNRPDTIDTWGKCVFDIQAQTTADDRYTVAYGPFVIDQSVGDKDL